MSEPIRYFQFKNPISVENYDFVVLTQGAEGTFGRHDHRDERRYEYRDMDEFYLQWEWKRTSFKLEITYE